jgi:ABC-2 type transport system permease protein
MNRFFAAFIKETLLLIRDRAGMIILFLMPTAMVFIFSIVQDSAFTGVLQDPKIQLLLINNDKDTLGKYIEEELVKSGYFSIVRKIDGKDISSSQARDLVASGEYQISVIIPAGASKSIRKMARNRAIKTLSSFGFRFDEPKDTLSILDSIRLTIYLDPAIKRNLKITITSELEKYTTRIETKTALRMFSEEMNKIFPASRPVEMENTDIVLLNQEYAANKEVFIIPTTTQHNVPSWTLFGMFFIVIPLAGSMIRDREEGSIFRIKTMPTPYITLLLAKLTLYMIVCMIQFVLMLMVGLYLVPLIGLPMLDLGAHPGALLVIAFAAAFAAIGFGTLIGTVATTHIQASSFGAVSIIILAALGGIWLPVYLMSETVRQISAISPLNWGMTAFYDVFIRGANIKDILQPSFLLFAFFVGCMIAAHIYYRWKENSR